MLRIGTPPTAAPEEPPVLAEDPIVAPEAPPDQAAAADEPTMLPMAKKIHQQLAGYMGSEAGPFECQRCDFFEQPGSCTVVDGDIDPQGCCNNFTPMMAEGGGEEPMPEEQEQETPDEEAAETPEEEQDENA